MVDTNQAIKQPGTGTIILHLSLLIPFVSFVNACIGTYYFVRFRYI